MYARKRLFLVGLLFSCGVAEDEEENAYVLDPYPDEISVPPLFCKWREIPPGPEGTTAHRVGKRSPLKHREDCTEFSAEEVDRELYEIIEEECDQPVEEFLRGCYWLFEQRGECSFDAYYFSACEVVP